MGYVGNKPALNYTTFAVQHFTTSATTGYTLDNAVTNENDIRLVINNVVQQPGSSYAYTATGTTLTLSAATTSSDTMYCVFLGKAVQTVNPGAGSVGTSQLATDAVTTVKITDTNVTGAKLNDDAISAQDALGAAPADTDEFLVSDAGVLKRVDYSYIKGITQTSFLPTAQPLIINGDFAVAQRNSGTVVQSDGSNEGYATVDRWQLQFGNSAGGAITTSRDNEAPTGFGQSYKLDCTTADASVGATHIVYSYTTLESQTIRNSGWDYTSSSSYLTLSFWVRSSKTGIYCVFFQSNDGTSKMYTQEYTVSVADTWEKKVITLPGDSGISFDNDNGSGLGVAFVFAVGTDRDGTAGAWTTGNAYGTSNQVNFLDSTSNIMYITGVQLEVGEYTSSTIPPFRHESYGDNLRRCQRYFYNTNINNTANVALSVGAATATTGVYGQLYFPVAMRANPTGTVVESTDYWALNAATGTDTFDNILVQNCSTTQGTIYCTGNVSQTAGQASRIRYNNTAARLFVNAEL